MAWGADKEIESGEKICILEKLKAFCHIMEPKILEIGYIVRKLKERYDISQHNCLAVCNL